MQAVADTMATMPQTPQVHGMNAFKAYGVSKEKVMETAREFEEVFMGQMLKPMWEGRETDGMFGGGPGEDVMRDMMVQEYGKSLAQSSGYPMSKEIAAEMILLQEQANGVRD